MRLKKRLKLISIIAGCFLLLTITEVSAQSAGSVFEKAEKANIDQNLLSELQSRARQRGITEQDLKLILESAVTMAEQQLPAEVAIQKSLEGFSKGIPNQQVVSVVNQLQKSMIKAAEVVDPWLQKPPVKNMLSRKGDMNEKDFRANMTKAASKSLMNNVSADAINNMLSQMEEEQIFVENDPADMVAAVSILSDLPSESEFSIPLLMRALKGGFKADQLHRLPAALKVGQRRTQLPAASIMEGVGRQVMNGIPASQVLQNIFEGQINEPPGQPNNGINNPGNGRNNAGNGRNN